MATEINIRENVKKHRTKQGLSQEDFAKKSGVVTKPSVQTIQKIAKSLGVPMEELLK